MGSPDPAIDQKPSEDEEPNEDLGKRKKSEEEDSYENDPYTKVENVA